MGTEHAESREEQATRELGHTDVSRGVAVGTTLAFAVLLLGVGVRELARDATRSAAPWAELISAPAQAWKALRDSGPSAANRVLQLRISTFEAALEEASSVTERALPRVQHWLTQRLGTGNEQVVVGRQGWLYFRPALDHLTGPGFLDAGPSRDAAPGGASPQAPPRPDPLPAIADFGAQLAQRGIGLVVVVTPVKASLHPEGLVPALAGAELPLENPSLPAFVERLAAMEIPVYLPGRRLAAALRETSWPQFLRSDTHWTPQAMEQAAEGLREFLSRHVALPERNPVAYERHETWVEARGDLQRLLRLPADQQLFPAESVLTHAVAQPGGEPWRPDPDADILVLGDSFTNVYSQAELGWGEAAGFAEQLSQLLRRPVDKLAVNAGGPSAARERLALQLGAGDDRLAGKRLVVYQFSARELTSGDWRLVELPYPSGGVAAARRRPEQGVPARGFVAWESNRSGDWRIWSRRLEGSAPRQLSPDEPERQHCCTHVSPDGSRLVYLSRAVPRDTYPELEVAGELRLLSLDGSGERTLASDARPYGWGNRAVVWRNDREVIYVGAEGRTFLLDVTTGAARPLTHEPRRKLAWLLDATLTHAVKGGPAFSSYDAAAESIVEAELLPGCEPYFTHDGRFGFWVRGGGGPVRWIDLQSRENGVLLEKDDARIRDDQRYVYFPMVSRDSRMLAFGASPGDHDHAWSNYDIFVAPLDPASLELRGGALRVTAHPASDRYPDVHVETLDLERWEREAPAVPAVAPTPAPAAVQGTVDVRATLQACSRIPTRREISPYDAALVVCEWRSDVAPHAAMPDTRLRLAHWAWRAGERQPVATLASGVTALLRVEPLAGVEIEGYPVFDTLPKAPELPVYYAEAASRP